MHLTFCYCILQLLEQFEWPKGRKETLSILEELQQLLPFKITNKRNFYYKLQIMLSKEISKI